MTLLLTLASEAIEHKTWWNPYLKGALVAILAIALFVGAAYLLLYTNVGSRLGFLLTAAAATGFMAVLSLFWITGQFANGPRGQEAGWPVEDQVDQLGETRIEEARNIETAGQEASTADAGQIQTEVSAELGGDWLTLRTLTKGGGRKWPMWWSERTTYAATEVCPATVPETLPLEPPPSPECDESEGTRWVISVKDLGSQRLPAWLFFFGSSGLFALALLSLHLYERDQQTAQETAASPDGDGAGDDGAGGDGAAGGDGRAEPEPEPVTT